MTRLGLIVFLVACSHSDAPPPAAPTVAVPAADPAPCPDVAAQAAKLAPGTDRAVIERHCIADTWSVEIRKCVLLAKTQAELEPCHQPTTDTTAAMPTAPPPDVPPPANAMPK